MNLLQRMAKVAPYEVTMPEDFLGWRVVYVTHEHGGSPYIAAYPICRVVMKMWVAENCASEVVVDSEVVAFRSHDDAMLFVMSSNVVKTPAS